MKYIVPYLIFLKKKRQNLKLPSAANYRWQTILMKYHTLFFGKLRKMLQKLPSAAVVIGALRVSYDIRGTMEN